MYVYVRVLCVSVCVCRCVCVGVCVCVCVREREREMLVVQWLPSKEIDTANQVQILDETVRISHNTNTLEKGKN